MVLYGRIKYNKNVSIIYFTYFSLLSPFTNGIIETTVDFVYKNVFYYSNTFSFSFDKV